MTPLKPKPPARTIRAGGFCLPIGLSAFENGLGLLCHTAAVILEYSLGLLHIVYGDGAEMDVGLLSHTRGIYHHTAAYQHMVKDGRDGALAAAIDKACRGKGSIILLPPGGMWFIIHISKTLYRDEVVR